MKVGTRHKARQQKLFRNGGSQAVRIPKEMKFETEEVLMHKDGDRLIIEPRAKTLKGLARQMGSPLKWNWANPDAPTQAEDIF